MTAEEFFDGNAVGLAAHRWVCAQLGEDVEIRVTRSQVSFRHRRGFAYLWRPGQYVRSDVPVVLSLALPHEVRSPRWKEVVQVAPNTWMHHLEVSGLADLDDEVADWLAAARAAAR